MLITITLSMSLFSLVFLILIIVSVCRNLDQNGCPEFLMMCIGFILWEVCAWGEVFFASSGSGKLFWHSMLHIGIFFTVPSFFSYVLHYTGQFRSSLKAGVLVIYILQSIRMVFVITNPWLHLYWKPVTTWELDDFHMVWLQSTPLGTLSILFGLSISICSSIILLIYCIRSKTNNRRQALSVLIASAFVEGYIFARYVLCYHLDMLPPAAFMFFIPALIVWVGIVQYDFVSWMPIAYQEVFEVIGEGVVIFSKSGDVLSSNHSARQIFALHGHSKLENSYRGLMKIRDIIETRFPDWKEGGSGFRQFGAHIPSDDRVYYYRFYMYPFYNQNQKRVGTILMIRDVTQEHEQTKVLEYQAERDGLTGVYNRPTFARLVENRLGVEDGPWSMLYLDLDHFKRVNDTYGHVFGDQVLQETCACIAKQIGDDGILGRVGGEEFVGFLSKSSCRRAAQMAEQIRVEVEKHVFYHMETIEHITISIGVVSASSYSFDEFYQRADSLLYQAKSEGRNCVRMWCEDAGLDGTKCDLGE